jgi:hypothetical protein
MCPRARTKAEFWQSSAACYVLFPNPKVALSIEQSREKVQYTTCHKNVKLAEIFRAEIPRLNHLMANAVNHSSCFDEKALESRIAGQSADEVTRHCGQRSRQGDGNASLLIKRRPAAAA